MNSIYNDDIAIRNTIKGNTMSNKNNNTQDFAALSADILADGVEEIANNLDITDEERMMILEAAARVRDQSADADLLNDWQNSALSATDERDRLRVREAELEARIDLLQTSVSEMEKCILQMTLDRSRLRNYEHNDTVESIIRNAGQSVERIIRSERHSQEDAIGDAINDLKNGDY